MSSGSALSPTVNGTSAVPLVPTNTVTTASGLTVRTRIDPVLTVDDVVRQLCLNLKIKEPPSNFALRDEMDELVTNDNLRKKIKAKVNLKLVNAPSREAMEAAEKLRLRDDSNTLKMTLFTLQKYIREEQFAQSFINCSGLSDLIAVIFGAHGNTLAYALTAMQNLMELDYGWASLDDAFILQVVQILSSPQSLINVCRPATAILKKLVEADPMSAPGLQLASSSRGVPSLPPGSVYRYGFSVVFEQMRKGRGFLETVISRLGSADTAMAQYSMMLINSLLAHASDTRWEEFISELESLNVRKAVVRLMSSHTIEDLTSCILDFQANYIRIIYRKKTTLVDLEAEASHVAALKAIWASCRIPEAVDENGQVLKWRLLGFDAENVEQEFNDVGVLGLECLRKFVEMDPDFSKIIQEQLSRPPARRCPVGKASNEVVDMLSEHWEIFAPGYSTSTTFQPFFLDFYKVHSLATHFFIRMWSESGAASGDFTRVAALLRSQAKVALRSENVRSWHEVEHDFNECEYRSVRERQMKELELEDDLLSKIPIRNLRAKLYKESYEFVRQQRIQCLMQGAWFINALPQNSAASREAPRRPNRPWRFMRLDPALKHLHYVDSAMKFAVRSGLEDLPERIDVAAISEIATGSCAAPPHVLRDQIDLPPAFPPVPSPLSFSLLSAHEGSLADQIAPDQSRWADWTDGLNMLRRDGGHVASKETAGFVQALTEIGLKIKLLDLSGEMVEIPSGLVTGPPPSNTDFFFSDLM
ncbi:ELMO/CED-12 family-domain-containing protein [Mycena pura]|uniref:ELMO/CED-12 family-domain-containing protein n=1 Tax=Mycena pura TaxID=153505 RepID=A0AAD6YMZ6_9AGAR|nr:ELMO/CED-12 family-domain-containing protein [Mycena pura]